MSNLITKKNIYLLGVLVICLLAFILTPTLAKFDSSFLTEEDVVGLTLSFNIGISNIEEYEEIVVDANSYEVFNVNIKNSSDAIAYYGIWYKMVTPLDINEDITIARLDGTEVETSGNLDSNEDKTVTIIIKNLSSDAIKVNIGVNSSTTSTSDIEYLGGKYLITGTSLEADYYYDNTNSRYVSVSDNSVTFTASTTNFDHTGDVQTFTAPIDGAYKIEAWGASGGDIRTYVGGKGAYTTGVVTLSANDNLYVYVGGAGSNTDTGGYNGGSSLTTNQKAYGSSGGGATDIRLVNGMWDNITGLTSRIMVAAGGGGANDRNGADSGAKYGSGNGGAGGTLKGIDGEATDYQTSGSITTYDTHYVGTGGTQIEGGWQIKYNTAGVEQLRDISGRFGNANPVDAASVNIQSGGGSGYYGGGRGGHGGAGGGSSYISGYKGTVSAGNTQKIKFVYENSNGNYVLNGYDQYENLFGAATGIGTINNIDRTLNYIGKSNWSGDGYFYGQIFNLKVTLKDGTVVLHYDFTKNSINDLSGNEYHGTLYNGASLEYNGKRYALVLDGVDDYMQVPTLPGSINFAGGFTIEFEAIWNGVSSYSRIIDFGNGGPSDNILINNHLTNPNIVFQLYTGTDGSTLNAILATNVIKLNETNYGKDKQVCETGDSDISCSYHYSGKVFKKANMIAGNASMPTHDGSGTMTGNSGNGYAKISLVVPTIEEDSFSVSYGETLKISDITCVDNGSGCKVVRINPGDTGTLSSGTYDINIMVIDNYGVVYQYTKSITVEANEIISSEETGEEVDNPVGGTTEP